MSNKLAFFNNFIVQKTCTSANFVLHLHCKYTDKVALITSLIAQKYEYHE